MQQSAFRPTCKRDAGLVSSASGAKKLHVFVAQPQEAAFGRVVLWPSSGLSGVRAAKHMKATIRLAYIEVQTIWSIISSVLAIPTV